MSKTVYISGPMTGYEHLNFPAFNAAEAALAAMGYTVVNPAQLPQPIQTWEACMKTDIREMMRCDTVVTLPGWRQSKGAQIEVALAKQLGMDVIEYHTLTKVPA